MLTLKLSARPSTSVLEMAQEDSPSTASSAPMALCSSSSISSVTGGSMWTAPLPRTSGHSMRKLQQKEKQTLLQELEVISMLEAREEVEEEQEFQGSASAPRGSYASPSGGQGGIGADAAYGAPGGLGGALGGYARNSREVDLEQILQDLELVEEDTVMDKY